MCVRVRENEFVRNWVREKVNVWERERGGEEKLKFEIDYDLQKGFMPEYEHNQWLQ